MGLLLPCRAAPAGSSCPVSAFSLTEEIRRYAVEVAGLRVGTMTATRQPMSRTDVRLTLVSDVEVNFLVYHLKVYYKVVNQVRNGQLLLSTVEAHTNQGDFSSRTEWKGDHYDIVANQYKHEYRGTETQLITYTVTDMYFGEPQGQQRAFSEYFGDYFTLAPKAASQYRARRDGREDEYHYTGGLLTTIIKKNPLKNFNIRLLPPQAGPAGGTSSAPSIGQRGRHRQRK